MATIWRALPILSIASINELRTAVYEAGGSPATWTDEQTLPADATLKSVYVTEIRDAIQGLWDDRGLGLIPNWTSGAEPTEPAPGTPLPLQAGDITDLRKWFNHFESWGDLRGVHWWKDTTPADVSVSALPKVGWNVELVYGVSNSDGTYNSGEVARARRHCVKARNYGLVNIVRIDWKGGHAVPTERRDRPDWARNFKRAVNALKDVATIFIVGNEPNIEPDVAPNTTGGQYGEAFNFLYGSYRVVDTMYLAAGPALFRVIGSGNDRKADTVWLENASNQIARLDGWALHTYGGPYLPYASDAGALCNTATVDCPIDRDKYLDRTSGLTDDAGFRRYRNLINKIRTDWAAKPVYITETNTSGYKSDPNGFNKPTPVENYVDGWIQTSYQEIRNYNSEHNSDRNEWPPVLCLCWFVDDNQDGNWGKFALSNDAHSKLRQARADFKASDTSTGIVKVESALGPATAELPAGVTRLAPLIG